MPIATTLPASYLVAILLLVSALAGCGDGGGVDTGSVSQQAIPENLTIVVSGATEGDSGSSNLTFTATLEQPIGREVIIDYNTLDGSASSASDYQAVTGSMVLRPGTTSASLNIPIYGDTLIEGDEVFVLQLSSTSGVTLNGSSLSGLASIEVTIHDDDMPTVSMDNASVVEGNSGNSTLIFNVVLDQPASSLVSVDYATSNLSAFAGSDYSSKNGTLYFAPGQQLQTVAVEVRVDPVVEMDETLLLELSNPVGASLQVARAIGTIGNDDLPAITISDGHYSEGENSPEGMVFVLTLDQVTPSEISLGFATSDVTASSGSDYIATSGTLTFAPGETSKRLLIPILDDDLIEPDEVFRLSLTTPTAATLTAVSALGYISDDDVPTVQVSSAEIPEGDTGNSYLNFNVTLDQAIVDPVTLEYATSDGTATAGSDYIAVTGSHTFSPGERSMSIAVPIVGDLALEPNETLNLIFTRPANATLAGSSVVGTIVNDDMPTLSINSTSIVEGDSVGSYLDFHLTLDQPVDGLVAISYATADATAMAGSDYAASSGRIYFLAGETSKHISIPVLADTFVESDESLWLNLTLSSPNIVSLPQARVSGTIVNDDHSAVRLTGAAIAEGNSGSSEMLFNITLEQASPSPLSLTYSTSDETATAGSDYLARSGSITLAAGVMNATFSIPVIGDQLVEGDEQFKVTLTSPSPDSLVVASTTATISDDDTPSLTLLDSYLVEGDSGSSTLAFLLNLDQAPILPVSVAYTLRDGTATVGSDYSASSGVINFAPGALNKTVTIQVLGDTSVEPDEYFTLDLSSPVGVNLVSRSAIGSITNDDIPTLGVTNVTSTESAGAATGVAFTLTLDQPALSTVEIAYATSDGTATAGSDYTPTSGVLSFSAGELSKSIMVSVIDDTLVEMDEEIVLGLSNPVGVHLNVTSVIATIQDDDAPLLDVTDTSLLEGNAGGADMVFTLTLQQPSLRQISVDYATSDGTATAGSDYMATASTLTFSPGETSKVVKVYVIGDTLVEGNENFILSLSNPSGVTLSAATAVGTISNDDSPSLTVSDATLIEGDAGSRELLFNLTLQQPSTNPVTLTYTTNDGSAMAGSDYTSVSGSLNFASGELTKQIAVAVVGDTLVEADERLMLTLNNVIGATLAVTSATGTIQNDDVQLQVADVVVIEGDQGNTDVRFSILLEQPSATALELSYITSSGSATEGVDYLARQGSLVFAPGEISQELLVPVVGDVMLEGDETFSMILTNSQNQAILASSMATIRDDDSLSIGVSDTRVVEGDLGSGLSNMLFTLTLNQPSTQVVSLNYATADGTATAGSDYVPINGTLVFNPGETSKTITVHVIGDDLVESDESLTLGMTLPVGATLLQSTASGTITNDDQLPPMQVNVADAMASESDQGSLLLEFVVNLNQPAVTPLSLNYLTQSGSATQDSDYSASSGTLQFAAGATSQRLSIPILPDTLIEGNEVFTLHITSATGEPLVVANGTIVDDDLPGLSIMGGELLEGDVDGGMLDFTVTLSPASPQTTRVDYATRDVTALAGSDYNATSGSLTFAPGETQKTISVVLNGDTLGEAHETFIMLLNRPMGASLLSVEGVGTIRNDDDYPLSVVSPRQLEGDSGNSLLSFNLTLAQPLLSPLSVDYLVQGGSATQAVDYLPLNGSFTFNAGVVSHTLEIPIIGDPLVEADETLTLILRLPGGVERQVVGTILNDDLSNGSSPLWVADGAVNEGNGGLTTLDLVLTLNTASAVATDFSYSLSDGTASAGVDYVSTAGHLSFAPGETSQRLPVYIFGDTLREADETFTLSLFDMQGSLLTTATVTIISDDLPTISITNSSTYEGDSGVSEMRFVLTLSELANGVANVDYQITPGTAQAMSDYLSASGTLSVSSGTTSTTLIVRLVGDQVPEADESLVVTLSNPSANILLGAAQATGLLLNDDLKPVPLNDTGLSWGVLNSQRNLDCSGSVIEQQDCSHGRDVTRFDPTDGPAGFSYTKLDANGLPLSALASQWDCVRDNVTGLIWEVKSGANGNIGDQGLHDADDSFSWYSTDLSSNGGSDGFQQFTDGGVPLLDKTGTFMLTDNNCSGYIEGDALSYCNTQAFIARVNAAGWCGAHDWRLPTIGELDGLLNFGRQQPAISLDWFPYTPATSSYWSSTPAASKSWLVSFNFGQVFSGDRYIPFSTRLVRDAP